MMNLRWPPSSALLCMTASAVVAEPEKKSRIISFSEDACLTNDFISKDGFGKSKILPLNISETSLVPSSVWIWWKHESSSRIYDIIMQIWPLSCVC